MSDAPAGWYPQNDGRQRYWDGSTWTEHYAQPKEDLPGSRPSVVAATGGTPLPDGGSGSQKPPDSRTGGLPNTSKSQQGDVATRTSGARFPFMKWLIPAGVGLVALLIGVGIGSAGKATPTASGPSSTVTVTASASALPADAITTTATVTATVTAPAETVTAQPAGPTSAFDEGTLTVGDDIQPGTYKAPNPSGNCYWARLKGTSGELGDIISNGNPSGPVTVTIKATDKAFDSSRCGGWTKVG